MFCTDARQIASLFPLPKRTIQCSVKAAQTLKNNHAQNKGNNGTVQAGMNQQTARPTFGTSVVIPAVLYASREQAMVKATLKTARVNAKRIKEQMLAQCPAKYVVGNAR